MKRVVMYQQWNHLLFLHWKVNQDEVRKWVPEELEIDTFKGDAYFGLVLFTMRGIRPRFVPPLPSLSAFHEFNARTYVKKGDKKGVWFFSLDAANSMAVRLARKHYFLPYYHAEMNHERTTYGVTYHSKRCCDGANIEASAEVSGDVWRAQPGTLDHFLVERYRLFAKSARGLVSLQVQHPPYPLRTVNNVRVEESLSTAAHVQLSGAPIAHYVEGVSVRIGPIERE
jgi:uncharacterized protein YqjF (DUF2071 family)